MREAGQAVPCSYQSKSGAELPYFYSVGGIHLDITLFLVTPYREPRSAALPGSDSHGALYRVRWYSIAFRSFIRRRTFYFQWGIRIHSSVNCIPSGIFVIGKNILGILEYISP